MAKKNKEPVYPVHPELVELQDNRRELENKVANIRNEERKLCSRLVEENKDLIHSSFDTKINHTITEFYIVPGYWPCPGPIGRCVYYTGFYSEHHRECCFFCGEPEERK